MLKINLNYDKNYMKQVIILIIMATSMVCVIDFLEQSDASKETKQVAFFLVPILLFLIDYFYLNQGSIDLFKLE
jgi:hypothetical protein